MGYCTAYLKVWSDFKNNTKEKAYEMVWSDFKNNTKKKAARLHKATSGTGGGPAIFSKLSVLEHRVLNLIGIQVATGLAVEEAGFSQEIPIEFGQMSQIAIEESAPVIFDGGQVEENVELWNRPSPSHHIAPPLLTPPLPNEEAEVQPASSGQFLRIKTIYIYKCFLFNILIVFYALM